MKLIKLLAKLVKYLLIAVLLAVIFVLIILFSSYQDIKQTAQASYQAKHNLELALVEAQAGDFNQALLLSQTASLELAQALETTEKISQKKVFSKIGILGRQVLDLEYLLKSISLLSASAERVLAIAQEYQDLLFTLGSHDFANLPVSAKQSFLQVIAQSEPELTGIRANLEIARLNLGKIRQIGVLYPIYQDIAELKDVIGQIEHFLLQSSPYLRLLPVLAGYPQSSNYLLIMHNNDELRPSGGFIGVFGLLTMANGQLELLSTHDSYHLDMPAVGKWIEEPPLQIKTYMSVQNWYLRDANWWPDWPSSALNIQRIYHGEKEAIAEASEEFVAVIGITPRFVSDLLALVGNIEVGGDLYTPDNLQELLQYSVEISYLDQGIPSWDRKDVVNELLAQLKDRLFSLSLSDLPQLLNIIETNIERKDIQAYFNNPVWQGVITELGASGEVSRANDKDFLLVVDANLAAFKSDSVVAKSINYEVDLSQAPNKAKLSLAYDHQGGFDWRTTRYRSYTRVYLPANTNLDSIKASGAVNLEADSINSYYNQDIDKTVVGFFFTLEPGHQGALVLDYTLPFSFTKDNYHLIIQKQAGRRTEELKVKVDGHDLFTPAYKYYPALEVDLEF